MKSRERERERAKEVGLNINVEKTNSVVQNRRTRKTSEILRVKTVPLKVLGMLNTWGL